MKNQLVANQLQCKKQHTNLFSDLSFKLAAGEMLVVTGDNGSGKSSLLRLLAGFTSPTSGHILWDNKPIDMRLTAYRQHLHYLGHANGLRLDLTIAEQISADANDLLKKFNLINYQTIPTRLLSEGQKRKVALINLLTSNRTIWLLDEPLTSLDNTHQALFLNELINHLQNGGITVISTHQPLKINYPISHINLLN